MPETSKAALSSKQAKSIEFGSANSKAALPTWISLRFKNQGNSETAPLKSLRSTLNVLNVKKPGGTIIYTLTKPSEHKGITPQSENPVVVRWRFIAK